MLELSIQAIKLSITARDLWANWSRDFTSKKLKITVSRSIFILFRRLFFLKVLIFHALPNAKLSWSLRCTTKKLDYFPRNVTRKSCKSTYFSQFTSNWAIFFVQSSYFLTKILIMLTIRAKEHLLMELFLYLLYAATLFYRKSK